MTSFRFEPLTEENKKVWNDFCLSCRNAWYWHTVEFQEFTLASCRPGTARNLSFLVYDNDRVAAAVPLLVCGMERVKGRPVREIVFAGWANPYPALWPDLVPEAAEELTGLIFDRIDGLAQEAGVSRAAFSIFYQQADPFRLCLQHNIMLDRPGFLDVSEAAQVIDLSGELGAIENGFRKRFMRYIRANKDKLAVEIITDKNISRAHYDECLALSGRDASQEWPAEKMPYLYDEVAAGRGIFVCCRLKENRQPVGYLFVIVYKGYAYDFAVAVDDEYKDLRVSHAMKLAAVRHLKTNGVRSYELGINTYRSSLHRIATEKRRAISYFKSGFVNELQPMFIAEKFYDRHYLLALMGQRVKSLESDLFTEEGVKNEKTSV